MINQQPVVVLEMEEQPPKAFTTRLFGIEKVLVAQRTSQQVYSVINRMTKLNSLTPEEKRSENGLNEVFVCQVTTIEDALRFNIKTFRWFAPWRFWSIKKWNLQFKAANIRHTLTVPQVARLCDLIQTLEEHGEITLNGEGGTEKKKVKVTAAAS